MLEALAAIDGDSERWDQAYAHGDTTRSWYQARPTTGSEDADEGRAISQRLTLLVQSCLNLVIAESGEGVMDTIDPVLLFERAVVRAAAVMEDVEAGQLASPTPCAEWTVQQLIDHMVGSTDYLLAALAGREPTARSNATAGDYRAGAARVIEGLRRPGGLDRVCLSPLGFEWSTGQATAGTFMDNLIHTWDLATATDQDPTLDAGLVDACVVMFLPDMPERGRAAGIVGPAVTVPVGASAQDRLLGAMGRRP